jgi:hypothetical protein
VQQQVHRAPKMSNRARRPVTDASHATIHLLAARAGIDPRTAERVLSEGVATLRARTMRERVAAALAELGFGDESSR